MPSKTPSKKQVQVEVKEEEMEVDSTAPAAKTPKTPKKTAQAKLTSFFGNAAKPKSATGEGSTVSGSSGLKSPKKEEPESPVGSPVKRKSGGGKNKDEKKGKTAPKEVEIKKEIKEEPMDEEEEEGSESGSGEYEVDKIVAHFWDEDDQLMFKVKWVGFEKEEEQTDEPEANLETATEKIKEYLQSLPKKAKDEYEKKTGKKIAGPPKGAKKRPISETVSTPSFTANKKAKKDESEKENGSKRSAGGRKQEKSKKNASKTPNSKVKKESKTPEERIAFIEERRQKAFEYSAEDPIGKAIQKGHEALIDMIRTDADPHKLAAAVESLKNERAVCLEADRKSGKKDPLRDAAYTILEKLEKMLISVAARETERARIKQEQQEGDDDTVSLMAVSRVVVDGIEVKEEDDGDIEKEVKTEEVEAQ